MIVSLSTGSVRHAAKSRLDQIHFVEKHFGKLVDGAELCVLSKEEFFGLKLDKQAIKFLEKLEFTTLHAPLIGTWYGKNKQTEKIFEKVRKIDRLVGLKQVNFHPNHVKDLSILKNVGLNVCIENLGGTRSAKGWQTPKEIGKALKRRPWLGFCFDVNHGMASGVNPSEFISELGDRISYIHLNATEKKGFAEHNLVVESSERVRQMVCPVFDLEKPLVIEVDNEAEKIPLIKEEIKFLRNFCKK